MVLNIVGQLVDIYLRKELWHGSKLSEEEAVKYFGKMLTKGRILYCEEEGVVVGYVEVWRIGFEQVGRLMCGEYFSAYEEDVEEGKVAYVANTWIRKSHRRGKVYKDLRNRFYSENYDECEYFMGKAKRKKTGLVKVFTKDQVYKKMNKKDSINKGV